MAKKILSLLRHYGGVNAVVPVLKRLNKDSDLELINLIGPFKEGFSDLSADISEKFEKEDLDYRVLGDYSGENFIRSLDELQKTENPSFYLAGTSLLDMEIPPERLFFGMAKKNKIPSLSVLDWGSDYLLRYGSDRDFHPDKIAVLDFQAKEDMLKEGFSENIIEVTGNPDFDDAGALKDAGRERQLRREFNLPGNKIIIPYISDITSDLEGLGWNFRDSDCLETLCEGIVTAGKSSEVELVLRKHPREIEENFQKLIEIPPRYSISSHWGQKDIMLTVLASDYIVGIISTVLLKSVFLGKDSISIQPGDTKEHIFNPEKMGLVPTAHSREEGAKLIRDILSGEYDLGPYQEKRDQLNVDGKSTDRILDLVYTMLK